VLKWADEEEERALELERIEREERMRKSAAPEPDEEGEAVDDEGGEPVPGDAVED